MSDADFRTFYWPTLKAVMKGLIEQGIVPAMFAQGSYNKRLEVIADDELPAGSVMWMFDQTDMAAAKRALGGYACIAGNVPTALLALGYGGGGRAVCDRPARRVRHGRWLLPSQRGRARRREG